MEVSFAEWRLFFRDLLSSATCHYDVSILVDVCDALSVSARPNVAVECVRDVLLHIRNITGSNCDPQESYPD